MGWMYTKPNEAIVARSAKEPYRVAAHFENGKLVGDADWPVWAELGKLF